MTGKKDEVTAHFYRAFSGDPVDHSDHDAVVGYSTVDGINILTLTWNIGIWAEQERTLDDWKNVIKSTKSQFVNTEHSWEDVDLFFVGIQEAPNDFEPDIQNIFRAIREAMPASRDWGSNSIREGPIAIANKFMNFDVISMVMWDRNKVKYNPKIYEKFWIKQGFFKTFGGTKSATIIGTFYNMQSANGIKLAFANTHLPVKKSKKDYGLKMRAKGLKQILKKYRAKASANGVLFLVGDLNFREMSRTNPEDQFDVYQHQAVFPKLRKWSELKEREFDETCKRKTSQEISRR